MKSVLPIYAVIAACSFVIGCALPTAAPYTVEVTDQKQYDADLAACVKYAGAYKPQFDFGLVGAGAVRGAAESASGAAVNPLVPLLGAAGGASSAVIDGLDLLSARQRAVFLKCMDLKTVRDQSALVLEP